MLRLIRKMFSTVEVRILVQIATVAGDSRLKMQCKQTEEKIRYLMKTEHFKSIRNNPCTVYIKIKVQHICL